MPSLEPRELTEALLGRLPPETTLSGASSQAGPGLLSIPDVGVVRVCVWTATLNRPRNSSRLPEAKIQTKCPGIWRELTDAW